MTINVDGTDVDLTTDFGRVPTANIEAAYNTITHDATVAGNAGNNARTLKLKMKTMYTYLFGSSDLEFKRILTNDTKVHHRSGPSAWKLITEHAIKGDNQAIWRAENMIHTMTLGEFDHDVKRLIQLVIDNQKVLKSSGVRDSSIASNLFKVLCQSHND